MIVGPDRRYVCPLCKDDDEDLDHFLREMPDALGFTGNLFAWD